MVHRYRGPLLACPASPVGRPPDVIPGGIRMYGMYGMYVRSDCSAPCGTYILTAIIPALLDVPYLGRPNGWEPRVVRCAGARHVGLRRAENNTVVDTAIRHTVAYHTT